MFRKNSGKYSSSSGDCLSSNTVPEIDLRMSNKCLNCYYLINVLLSSSILKKGAVSVAHLLGEVNDVKQS